MLNGVVDLVLRLAVEVGQLGVGEDTQGVELLFAVGSDALDGLQVVGVLLGRLTDALEVKGLLSLLDAVHGLLLLRLRLVLVGHDGDFPQEVDAGLAQLDAARVGAAFVGGEFSVIELEVDDHFSVLTNSQDAGAFHAEGRLVHREATVVVLVVEVNHVDLDVAHVRDGDFFHRGFHRARLQRSNRSEDERIVLGTRTGNEVGFSRGVLGFWAVSQEDQQAVSPKQQRNDEQQQEQEQAREAPHPVDAVVVITASNVKTHGHPFALARLVVQRVRTTSDFLVVRQTVVVVVKVGGQVANIAFWQGIRNAVVVQVVEHRQGEGKELAVDRVVGPNREVHRLGGVGGRTADAAVHRGVSSRAPAEGEAFGQFANQFPGDHVTAAVDPR